MATIGKRAGVLAEKGSLDKALMTGQQKSGTNMYSTGSPQTQQKKRRKRGITHTKNRFQKPPKRTKICRKDYIHTKTTLMDKEKMSKQTNDLSKPFSREKKTQRKEEKPLRIHFRHFKNGPLKFLPHLKIIQSIHKQV